MQLTQPGRYAARTGPVVLALVFACLAGQAWAADGYIEKIRDYCYSKGTNIQPRELVVLAASPFGNWYCETPQVKNPDTVAKTKRRVLSRCNDSLSATQKQYAACSIVYADSAWLSPSTHRPLEKPSKTRARIVVTERKSGSVQSLDGFITYRDMHFDGSRTVSVVSTGGHNLCSGKYYLKDGSADLRLKCFDRFTFNTGRFQPQRYVKNNGALLPVFEKGFKRGKSSLSIAVTE